MSFTRNDDTTHVLTPDEHGDVWFTPLRNASVALQIATVITTSAATYRTPVVLEDPSADWGAEGSEITKSDPVVTEVSTRPERLAGLTVASREMLDDSGSRASEIISTGLIADIARKIDEAAFGVPASLYAPSGLRGVTGVPLVGLDDFENTDPFAQAQSLTEDTGRQIDSWVANPATVLKLQRLKESSASNRPLLGADVTVPTGRSILGVPLYSSPYVENGVVWGIPRSAFHVVLRTPAELSVSNDAYFSSYSVGIRAVQRVGMVVPHAPAIVKIVEDGDA